MLYVLTIAMQKGGVAKTTTAATLAEAAKQKGKKALAVDLDPQANLTFALKADPNQPGAYELIEGKAKAADLIQKGIVDIIPASRSLATLKTDKGSAARLRKALQPIAGNYDFIVIDTPTLEGELLYNALCASNGLLIPTQADIYNLHDIYLLKQTAETLKKKANPHLSILGYAITRADTRSIIARQMQEELKKTGLDCLGLIRNGIAIQEAAALQQSLFDYAPKSKPAADYMALYEAINKRQAQ